MNVFIVLLLALVTLHIIIDFYCQPSSWLQDKIEKKYKSIKLAIHSLLHGLVACAAMVFVSDDIGLLFACAAIIAISHWLIDLAKIYVEQSSGQKLSYFVIDQALHLSVLALIALYLSGLGLNAFDNVAALISSKNMLILLVYLTIFKPVSVFIGIVLKRYTPTQTLENQGLILGGEIIGYLERLLILTFIINGQYAVIGFILAAKSIFRFGELNNNNSQNLTEYVLLGSLLSITITSILGLFVVLLI
ncbi:DUF3307 domain-containing protein [Gammaproteobacteria bacterium AS21]